MIAGGESRNSRGAVVDFRDWYGEDAPVVVVSLIQRDEWLVAVCRAEEISYQARAASLVSGVLHGLRHEEEKLQDAVGYCEWFINDPESEDSENAAMYFASHNEPHPSKDEIQEELLNDQSLLAAIQQQIQRWNTPIESYDRAVEALIGPEPSSSKEAAQ